MTLESVSSGNREMVREDPASDTSSDNSSVMPELTNSSGEISDNESVMPELTDSSEDEFEIQANDSSEYEFDIRANGLRLQFAYGFRLQLRTEFQARGACHVHGRYWQ